MQHTDLTQYENTLETKLKSTLQFKVEEYRSKSTCLSEVSSEFVLCGLVKVQVKNTICRVYESNIDFSHLCIAIKLSKIFQADSLNYIIKFTSNRLGIEDKIFLTDDDVTNWQQLKEVFNSFQFINEMDIKLCLDICKSESKLFANIYDDAELSDFQLIGSDGSVPVHKLVLAMYSPVMKTMLCGQWKETAVGSLEVPNTNRETLQYLKDYMYLQKLPDHGIEKLAILASFYMMADLKQRCTVKLLCNLNAENAAERLEFAMKYKIRILMLAILESIKRDRVTIGDIDKNCSSEELQIHHQ